MLQTAIEQSLQLQIGTIIAIVNRQFIKIADSYSLLKTAVLQTLPRFQTECLVADSYHSGPHTVRLRGMETEFMETIL